MSDKIVAIGTNENGVRWEVLKDRSIGDHYLIIEGAGRPEYTGSKSICVSMGEGWVK